MKHAPRSKLEYGTLRIIGGQHRGRKLHFPVLEGVRPTPDRVRETLFNWLAMQVPGARCLDLFAGSGALGLEALSREAAEVTFVDAAAPVTMTLQEHLATLKAANGQVFRSDAGQWLKLNGPERPYDIVFLDPPFNKGLLAPICAELDSQGFVGPQSRIYLEAESTLGPLPLPDSWDVIRHKQAGQVQYALCVKGE